MIKNGQKHPFIECWWWKVIPLVVICACWLGSALAEPFPGYTDSSGIHTNRLDKVYPIILSDPKGIAIQPGELRPLRQEKGILPMESFRNVRSVSANASLMLAGGRTIHLLGCLALASAEEKIKAGWQKWDNHLRGKTIRLLFDRETRSQGNDLTAWVYLMDGRLLNEEVLAEGLARLDSKAVISQEYADRLKRAAVRQETPADKSSQPATTAPVGAKSGGFWRYPGQDHADQKSPDQEFQKHPGGFSGVSSRGATPGGAQRSGQDQSP
jgi:hypothetical protein